MRCQFIVTGDKMGDTHEDLDEFIEKFKGLFQSQHRHTKIENDLLRFTERLFKELESIESNAKYWESCYEASLNQDNATLTTDFVALKEKYDHQVSERNNLKMEFDEMEKQYQEKLENQKNDLTRRLTESEEQYKTEVRNLNKKIASDRICYETKEEELLNEMQASQAATALQIDEVETNLKSQIADLNNKLKQSQTHARTLMTEIGRLRNELVNEKQKGDSLYFQQTPIQIARNNIMCRSSARDLYNIYNQSEEDINSFDLPRSPSHSADLNVSNTTKENNIDNLQRNINNANIQPSVSLYSATPPIESAQPETNLHVDQIYQSNDPGSSSSFDQDNNDAQTRTRIFQQECSATPEKLEFPYEPKTFDPNKATYFHRQTGTPLYKGKCSNKKNFLPFKMPSSDTAKPKKRKLYDPDQSCLEPKE